VLEAIEEEGGNKQEWDRSTRADAKDSTEDRIA